MTDSTGASCEEEVLPDQLPAVSSAPAVVRKVSVNTWIANEIEKGQDAKADVVASRLGPRGAAANVPEPEPTTANDSREQNEPPKQQDKSQQRPVDKEPEGGDEEFLRRLQERTGLGVYTDTKRRRLLFAGKKQASAPFAALGTSTSSEQHSQSYSRFVDYIAMKVLDPWERPYYFCLLLSSIAALYNILIVITRVTFDFLEEYSLTWLILDYLADLIYIFDIAYQSRKGYLQDGILDTNNKNILKRYFCSWRPIVDIASVLPTELCVFAYSSSYTRTVYRFNRLLKANRLFEWLDRTWRVSNYPIIIRFCTLVVYFYICLHWNACIYFELSKRYGLGNDTWVVSPYRLSNESTDNETIHVGMYMYVQSMYWSAMRLTNIGEVPAPVTDGEMIFTIIDMLLAIAVFAGIFGSIEELLERAYEQMHNYYRWMDEVKKYMSRHSVPYELQKRIYVWMVHFWNQNHLLGGGTSSLAVLPDRLQAEINMNAHLDTLRRVRFFQDCEPGLLVALLNKLTLQMFNPGEYICRKGDVGKEMYIVKSGRLSVVGPDGIAVFATLTEGAVFGELSLLNISGSKTGNRRTASIRSNGYSDLFCLSKEDLWAALQDYPEARRIFIEKGREILIKDGLLDGYVRLDQFALLSQLSQYETVREKAEHLIVRISAMVVGMGTSLRNSRSRIRYLERELEKYREAHRRRKIQVADSCDEDSS